VVAPAWLFSAIAVTDDNVPPFEEVFTATINKINKQITFNFIFQNLFVEVYKNETAKENQLNIYMKG